MTGQAKDDVREAILRYADDARSDLRDDLGLLGLVVLVGDRARVTQLGELLQPLGRVLRARAGGGAGRRRASCDGAAWAAWLAIASRIAASAVPE